MQSIKDILEEKKRKLEQEKIKRPIARRIIEKMLQIGRSIRSRLYII